MRSSEASRTAKDSSTCVSIALREVDKDATSSGASVVGIRRLRSPAEIALAVFSISVSGRNARRTASQPTSAKAVIVASEIRAASSAKRFNVVETSLRGCATTTTAVPSSRERATPRHIRSEPAVPRVKARPLSTRGSARVIADSAGTASTSVAGILIAPVPDCGKITTAYTLGRRIVSRLATNWFRA